MNLVGTVKNVTALILLTATLSCAPTDESEWTRSSAEGPRIKVELAMVYDAGHEKIVAFGGRNANFDGLDETWVYDCKSQTWAEAKPAVSPPYRSSHTMAYDSARGKVLMFGGDDFTRAFNDLWEYDADLNTWTELTPENSPDARHMHGMSYDSEREILVMFGGRRTGGGASIDGTWEYSHATNSWRAVDPDHSPPSEDHVKIAYDKKSKRTILFSGATSRTSDDGSTWALEDGDWKRLETENSPTAGHAGLVYDTRLEKLTLIGAGMDSDEVDTWMFDGTNNEWTQMNFSSVPPIKEHFGLAYDEHNQTYLASGGFPNNEEWLLKLGD